MGTLIGLTAILPTIKIQAILRLLMLFTAELFGPNFETFAVLLVFFWWIRDMSIICQKIFTHLVDDSSPLKKPPLWADPAPYLPNGSCYGYAMSQYWVKKKSGHS